MSELPQIPGYRIIKKLGHGGMADVYLGVQKNLARKVAIKVLLPSLFRDQQFSTRFIKEAQTAAHLAHPNIITIHDIGKTGDSYYIVMEYLEESLSERLKKTGPLPPGEALEIVKMIAGALDYAHTKGFIHRDIKPDNIMFRADGTVVLVDFGIARAMDSSTQLTRTGMSIGTPHYMSPEQCKGEKIDGRSDIYSLGVELYELLTGDVPYRAESTAGIIIKHIQEPIPRLPKHLRQYQPLIDKMMAKERETRIQSGEELINFIDGLLTARKFMPPPVTETQTITEPAVPTAEDATVVTTYQSGTATHPELKQRKKWLLPALLILAFVILAGVSSVYFITRDANGVKEEDTSTQTAGEEKLAEKKLPEVKETEVEKPPIETTKTDEEIKIEEKEKKTKTETSKQPSNPVTGDAEKIQPPQEKKTQPIKQPEEKKPGKEELKTIKSVTLLGLDPDLRGNYNTRLQRIRIEVLRSMFRVTGQIMLNLSINEKGKVTVRSFRDMLTVTPPMRKMNIIGVIRKKINGIFLEPPKNKAGEPVRVNNWRLTYKVGKLGKTIFLNKQ